MSDITVNACSPGVVSLHGHTVLYDRREFYDPRIGDMCVYDEIEIHMCDGTRYRANRGHAGRWPISTGRSFPCYDFPFLVSSGIAVSVFRGSACYGHTDYYLADDVVAAVLAGVETVGR